MFTNKLADGSLNISGKKIAKLRKKMIPKVSQNGLARMLELNNLIVDKNAIQSLEAGKRFITDIELNAIAEVLGVTPNDLLDFDEK